MNSKLAVLCLLVASGCGYRNGNGDADRWRGDGMKWLADKSNCLTIRYGEGYCRD